MIPLLRRLGFVPAPQLQVSDQLINRVVLEERRREYAGDVEYRKRVMRRMLLGRQCPDPPLVKRWGWQ